jgi:hypothetical protein
VHCLCTVILERQCSSVLVVVVAPGFERFVVPRTTRLITSLALLCTARLIANLRRPTTTAVVAAYALAVSV